MMQIERTVRRPGRGFTLIELLVTVAVIAILAGIALPSYLSYIKRSDRADAKTALLMDAQFMERNFTEANRYDQDSGGTGITAGSLPYTRSPASGGKKYDITLPVLTATTFELRAVPVSEDECGTFTLNHLGEKDLIDATMANADEFCWNK